MAVRVRIPAPLRSLTAEEAIVTADGAATLRELVDELEASYPGMRERLCEDDGELRRFVNVFVNGEDVRFLSGLGSALSEGDEVSIVPAGRGRLLAGRGRFPLGPALPVVTASSPGRRGTGPWLRFYCARFHNRRGLI